MHIHRRFSIPRGIRTFQATVQLLPLLFTTIAVEHRLLRAEPDQRDYPSPIAAVLVASMLFTGTVAEVMARRARRRRRSSG